MKLSTRSRYGTRILVDLARHLDQGPAQSGDISKRQGISVKYLEQLIRPLQQAKYVHSVRGAKGGHLLARPPEEITLGQIVRLFEGHGAIVDCIEEPECCGRSDDCRVRLAWKEASEAFFGKLDGMTIADFAFGKEYPSKAVEACLTGREEF